MEYGLDKCIRAIIKHVKLTTSQSISLNSQTVIRNMKLDDLCTAEGESMDKQMKDKLVKEYYCQVSRQLNSKNKITAVILLYKGKAILLQAWSGPEGSRKLRFPDFMTTAQNSGKVVSLTHRLPLPPGNTPGTHFCYRLSRPQGHSATGRIMSLKNSNDTIGNRTRDLLVCSIVP